MFGPFCINCVVKLLKCTLCLSVLGVNTTKCLLGYSQSVLFDAETQPIRSDGQKVPVGSCSRLCSPGNTHAQRPHGRSLFSRKLPSEFGRFMGSYQQSTHNRCVCTRTLLSSRLHNGFIYMACVTGAIHSSASVHNLAALLKCWR